MARCNIRCCYSDEGRAAGFRNPERQGTAIARGAHYYKVLWDGLKCSRHYAKRFIRLLEETELDMDFRGRLRGS